MTEIINNNNHVVHKDTVQSKREISRNAPRNPIIELHLSRNDIRQHLYFSKWLRVIDYHELYERT